MPKKGGGAGGKRYSGGPRRVPRAFRPSPQFGPGQTQRHMDTRDARRQGADQDRTPTQQPGQQQPQYGANSWPQDRSPEAIRAANQAMMARVHQAAKKQQG